MNDIAIVSILENHFCHARKTSMRKVFYFDSLTILIRQAKCATSENLTFVNDTVRHGIQYFAIQGIRVLSLLLWSIVYLPTSVRIKSGLNESIQWTANGEWLPFDESASLPQKLTASFLKVIFWKVTHKRLGGDDCKDRQSTTRVVARMSPPPFSYYSAGTDQCQKV